MTGEVAEFTPEHEVQGSRRSRRRRIVVCVALIVLVCLAVAVGLAVTYAADDSPGLLVYPDTKIDLRPGDQYGHRVEQYIQAMTDFQTKFEDTVLLPDYLADCRFGYQRPEGTECRYDFRWLDGTCNKWENFGYYNDDKPCIVLAYNEPREWTPEPYTSPDELPNEMPQSLREHIELLFSRSEPTQFLWVSCTGIYPADKEFLGLVDITPWHGFPLYYFPVEANARPLLLSLVLSGPEYGVVIGIECHFWAKNLETPHVAARINFVGKGSVASRAGVALSLPACLARGSATHGTATACHSVSPLSN